jgi:hypothetical protein
LSINEEVGEMPDQQLQRFLETGDDFPFDHDDR